MSFSVTRQWERIVSTWGRSATLQRWTWSFRSFTIKKSNVLYNFCSDNHGCHSGWIGWRNGLGRQSWSSAERCYGGEWTGVGCQTQFNSRYWSWLASRVRPSWERERQSLMAASQPTNLSSTCKRFDDTVTNCCPAKYRFVSGPEIEFEHGRSVGTAPPFDRICQWGQYLEIFIVSCYVLKNYIYQGCKSGYELLWWACHFSKKLQWQTSIYSERRFSNMPNDWDTASTMSQRCTSGFDQS